MDLKKIIFQNRYVALKTPPPFMANTILNFHFDYLHTSLTSSVREKGGKFNCYALNTRRAFLTYMKDQKVSHIITAKNIKHFLLFFWLNRCTLSKKVKCCLNFSLINASAIGTRIAQVSENEDLRKSGLIQLLNTSSQFQLLSTV